MKKEKKNLFEQFKEEYELDKWQIKELIGLVLTRKSELYDKMVFEDLDWEWSIAYLNGIEEKLSHMLSIAINKEQIEKKSKKWVEKFKERLG